MSKFSCAGLLCARVGTGRSKTRVSQATSEIHRLKGEILLKKGDSNAAEARSCFERAIEIARKQSAKSWELRATTSLAPLLTKQGHRDEGTTRDQSSKLAEASGGASRLSNAIAS